MRKNNLMGKRLMVSGMSLAMALAMVGLPVSAQGPGPRNQPAMMSEKQDKETPPEKPENDNQDKETPPAKPEGDKAPTKPEGDEAPAKPEGDEAPAKPEGDEAPTKPEGDEAPTKPEGDEAPTKPEGDEAPTKPEGDEAPAKPEGDEAPAKPENDKQNSQTAPTKPEGESQNGQAALTKPEKNGQAQPEMGQGSENNGGKIDIVGYSRNIAAGKKVKLFALNNGSNESRGDLTWTSSNEKYASVDKNGLVTTKKVGENKKVTITAKSQDGQAVGSYTIKVSKSAVKAVKIKGKSSVKAGQSLKLKGSAKAGKGAYKTLKWTSSNTNYATVNSKGLVKTKQAGKGKTVTITASSLDGSNKKAVKKIKIK